jgi:translation elongation factor EF-1alpha
MKRNIVFYGNANHGKSTLIGHMVSELKNPKIDLDKMERYYKEQFGYHYRPDLLYTWLMNRDKWKSGLVPDELTGILTEGHIINETGESLDNVLRAVTLEIDSNNVDFTFIDTPGQHPETRDKVLHLGDVGVFCVEIGQVLKPDFDESYFDEYEIWTKITNIPNPNPIIILTKVDEHFSEEAYLEAVEKIRILGNYNESPIIPISVIVKERRSINVFSKSAETSWYNGHTLIDSIKRFAQE